MTLAEDLYRQGTDLLESDPARAVELLSESLLMNPDAPPAIYNRVVALARLGKHDEAINDLARLEVLEPKLGQHLRHRLSLSAAPYVDLAMKNIAEGAYKQALEACNSATCYNEQFPDAWIVTGIVQKRLGNFVAARQAFDRAVVLEPNDTCGWFNRAELLFAEGKFQAAIADYTHVIDLDPNDAEAWLGRASAREKLGLIAEADFDRNRGAELKFKSTGGR